MADLCGATNSSALPAAPETTKQRRNEPVVPPTPRSDDELLAFLLVSTWAIHTGRTLRDAAPDDLTIDELIAFWADAAMDEG